MPEDDSKELYEQARRKFASTSLSIFIVAMMFISTTTVLSVRERRAKFNSIVLKESNDKLEGLIWLLNCSIKMLDSLDQHNTENTIDRDKVDGQEAVEHLEIDE